MTIGELIASRRNELGMSQDDLARQLADASGRATLTREEISRWERNDRLPSRLWLPWLAEILGIDQRELLRARGFTRKLRKKLQQPMDEGLTSLLTAGEGDLDRHSEAALSVEKVEDLLAQSYRLDDELGGSSLWRLVETNLTAATNLFDTALTLDESDRLHRSVAGLTQMAGWISIDANRHAQANKYLTAALYTGYETDDDELVAHVLGYMSLHALYRERYREAISLARTSVDRTHGATHPSVQAILYMRMARAYARLGENGPCRLALDEAQTVFSSNRPIEIQPMWISYVDEVELAAQRGACLLDLGDGPAAAGATEDAIRLLQQNAPDRVRDLVHYKIRLASAYLGSDDPDHAAQISKDAYNLSAEIDSARVGQRMSELVGQLRQVKSAAVHEALMEIGRRPTPLG